MRFALLDTGAKGRFIPTALYSTNYSKDMIRKPLTTKALAALQMPDQFKTPPPLSHRQKLLLADFVCSLGFRPTWDGFVYTYYALIAFDDSILENCNAMDLVMKGITEHFSATPKQVIAALDKAIRWTWFRPRGRNMRTAMFPYPTWPEFPDWSGFLRVIIAHRSHAMNRFCDETISSTVTAEPNSKL